MVILNIIVFVVAKTFYEYLKNHLWSLVYCCLLLKSFYIFKLEKQLSFLIYQEIKFTFCIKISFCIRIKLGFLIFLKHKYNILKSYVFVWFKLIKFYLFFFKIKAYFCCQQLKTCTNYLITGTILFLYYFICIKNENTKHSLSIK